RRRIHRHKDPRSSTTLPGVPYYTHTPKTHPPRLPAARDDMIGAVRYVAGELGMRHAAEPLARDFAAAAQSLADLP
ncbi:hypothetical protein, partial [Bifidobacterium pullorum]|uniref:hypothetical protein n=1 Tax=Bifidobacterium pullorum TaxID=78448 RepID=UPI003F268535